LISAVTYTCVSGTLLISSYFWLLLLLLLPTLMPPVLVARGRSEIAQ
jgi:hypothetical protein